MSRDPLVPALGDVLAALRFGPGPRFRTASLWRTKFSAARRPAAPKRPPPVAELKRANEKLKADNDGLRREVDSSLFSGTAKLTEVAHLLLRIAERRKAKRGD